MKTQKCINLEREVKQDNPCPPSPSASEVYFSAWGDWNFKNGEFVLKRKYGKFKREIIKLEPFKKKK